MKWRLMALWLAGLTAVATLAHIGSPGVFFEGVAGPYRVRVIIQPPEVVPGLARISVRVHDGEVARVAALPVRWDAGRKGAPPPDVAALVTGETNLYSTELWLMDSGAYSVFVDVEGSLGSGTAIVPLNSMSSQRLGMPRWMGAAFLAAGAVLAVLLVLLVGAAVGESVVAPGENPGRRHRVRALVYQGIAVVVISTVLWKGKQWWEHVDREFRANRLYTPVEMQTDLRWENDLTRLYLSFDTKAREWKDPTPLVPDHGKKMHLFLVREPEMDVIAHLHPAQLSESDFATALPALPPGDYSAYGDVTHESGFARTLIARVKLPEELADGEAALDPDDSWWSGPGGAGPEVEFDNGWKLRWTNRANPIAGQDLTMTFELAGSDGKAAPIEPYMGMWSHAVIRSRDGAVFTHLHPLGTISMAAQELFAEREKEQRGPGPASDVICGRPDRELSFPYAFPRAGDYRVWVQVKSLGRVLTGAFDLTVR